MGVDVSVVVVNYNTGQHLLGFLEALDRETRGSGLALERIVVDNASPHESEVLLERIAQRVELLIRAGENRGYAGGCNLGLERARGRVLVCANADTRVVGNAIPTLVAYLDDNPDVGLVEPRTYIDEERTFLIPEFRTLNLRELWDDLVLRRSSPRCSWHRRVRLARFRSNLEGWRTREPREHTALTGAIFATRRATLASLGGLDTGYPLYFEDQDLFARMRAVGLRLVQHPGAEAVHFGHRSAVTDLARAQEKHARGRRRFLRTHCGRITDFTDRALTRVEAICGATRSWATSRTVRDLGVIETPPTFAFEGTGEYVAELSMEADFVFAVGALGSGEQLSVSPATWSSLLATTYYLRAWDASGEHCRGSYRFTKPG